MAGDGLTVNLARWLTGGRVLCRSTPRGSATEGALTWQIRQRRTGPARLEVLSRSPFTDRWHPHLGGLVLRTPPSGAVPEGWTGRETRRFSDVDGSEREVSAHWLVVDKVENLRLGYPWSCDLPVPAGDVAAVFFGSLTDHHWLENTTDHAWIVRYRSASSLFSWTDHIGSTPTIRSARVEVAECGRISIHPTGERPWPR